MLRKLLTLVAGILAGTVLFAAAAYADMPHDVYIRYQGHRIQQATLHEYDWHYFYSGGEDGSGWVHTWTTNPGVLPPPYNFPKAKRVESSHRVNLLLGGKPDKLTLRTKDGKPITYHLYPIKQPNGKVHRWGAWFKPPRGEHRFVIRQRFEREKGGYDAYGWASYLAHLTAR